MKWSLDEVIRLVRKCPAGRSTLFDNRGQFPIPGGSLALLENATDVSRENSREQRAGTTARPGLTGNPHGIAFDALYSIDPRTAASSRIGRHGVPGGNVVVFDTDGTLYSAGFSGTNLYTIDPSSGASLSLGSMGYSSGGDLAFVGDEFYLADSSSSLVSVDLDDLSASSRVGPFGVSNVYGIATDESATMYGVGGTTIFTVDTASGGAVNEIDYGGQGLGNARGQSFFDEAGAPPGTGSPPFPWNRERMSRLFRCRPRRCCSSPGSGRSARCAGVAAVSWSDPDPTVAGRSRMVTERDGAGQGGPGPLLAGLGMVGPPCRARAPQPLSRGIWGFVVCRANADRRPRVP